MDERETGIAFIRAQRALRAQAAKDAADEAELERERGDAARAESRRREAEFVAKVRAILERTSEAQVAQRRGRR